MINLKTGIDGYIYNDGGRHEAGLKGHAGDCVTRSIVIAAGVPYREAYDRLAQGNATQRRSKHTAKGAKSARNGINTGRKWFKDYMHELGFKWVATMGVGTGCRVHLIADELPQGRLIVSVSKHYTAMIDGVIHDTHDPRRETHHIESYDGQPLKPGQWVTKGNVNGGDGLAWVSRRCVYGYWIYEG